MGMWMRGLVVAGFLFCLALNDSPAGAHNVTPVKTPKTQAQPLKSNLQKATGRILDKEGKPVAGAQLYIRPLRETRLILLTTDKAGNFSAEAPDSNHTHLAAVIITHPQHGLIAGGLKSGANEFRFTEMTSVEGRVLDKYQKPVEGVAIGLSHWGWLGLEKESAELVKRYTVRSDAQGNWKIDGIPQEGSHDFELRDPRFVHVRQYVKTDAPASERPKIDFVARPSAYIEGRVVDEKQKPVAGLRVFVNQYRNAATTDKDGKYRIPGLASGNYTVMTDEMKSGGATLLAEAIESVQATEGNSTKVADLILRQPLFVRGTVTSGGQPVKGVMVGVQGPHRPSSTGENTSATTDENGQYVLPVLPGENTVYFYSAPKGYVHQEDKRVTPVKAGDKPVVNFALKRTEKLNGVVVDENGAPVSDVAITSILLPHGQNEQTTQSNAQGQWEIGNLVPGKTRFNIEGDWEIVGNAQIEIPHVTPLRLAVRRAPIAEFAGRIMTTVGQPVHDATVKLEVHVPKGEHSWSIESQTVKTNAEGRFSWKPKRRDLKLSSVKANREGYVFVSGGGVTQHDKGLTISDVVMAQLAGNRRGRVLDASGKPISGAAIYVPVANLSTQTDAKGEFEIGPLPLGKTEIWAVAPANAARLTFEHSTELSTPLELKIAAAKPLPERDIEGAYRILHEMWQQSGNKDWWFANNIASVLAPYDKERAKGFLSNESSVKSAIDVITSFKKFTEQDFVDLQGWLNKIESPTERINKATAAALKLAPHHPQMTKQLLEQARPVLKSVGFTPEPDKEKDLVFAYAQTAALAERLGERGAEGLADAAFVVAERHFNNQAPDEYNPGPLDDMRRNIIEKLGAGSASLVERASSELSGGMLARALSGAVKQLASHDVEGALRVLDKILPLKEKNKQERNFHNDPEFAFGDAAKAIVPVLGKRDPQAALKLAHRITQSSYRVQALASAAETLPLESAREVYRDALQQGYDWGNLTRTAALAWNRDRALGVQLFEQLKSKLNSEQSFIINGSMNAEFWFHYARISPGESRFQLEKMWSSARQQNSEWGNGGSEGIQIAMIAIDPQRALEMVDETSNQLQKFLHRQRVAQYLLLTNAERLKLPLYDWDASDMNLD